jgi:hypothetical protein
VRTAQVDTADLAACVVAVEHRRAGLPGEPLVAITSVGRRGATDGIGWSQPQPACWWQLSPRLASQPPGPAPPSPGPAPRVAPPRTCPRSACPRPLWPGWTPAGALHVGNVSNLRQRVLATINSDNQVLIETAGRIYWADGQSIRALELATGARCRVATGEWASLSADRRQLYVATGTVHGNYPRALAAARPGRSLSQLAST